MDAPPQRPSIDRCICDLRKAGYYEEVITLAVIRLWPHHRPMTSATIGKAMDRHPNTILHNLSKLVRKGFLSHTRSARGQWVIRTDDAARVADEIISEVGS